MALYEWTSPIPSLWVSWFFGIPWLLISWCFSFPFLFFLFLFFLLLPVVYCPYSLAPSFNEIIYLPKEEGFMSIETLYEWTSPIPLILYGCVSWFFGIYDFSLVAVFLFRFCSFRSCLFLSCLLYTARNLGHHLFWLVMKLFTSKKKEEDLWASRQCYPNNETGTTGGH